MNMIKNFIIISIIITNLFGNSLSDAFVKVAEIANPAVVSILGTQNVEKSFNNDPFYRHFQDFFELPENYGTSLGSGVIIDAENGYILTNNHVVKEADEIGYFYVTKENLQLMLLVQINYQILHYFRLMLQTCPILN